MRTPFPFMLALALLAPATMAGDTAASDQAPRRTREPARMYRSAVFVGGTEVIAFEIASPRIPASELGKVISDEAVLKTLNEKHLSNLGVLDVGRPCRIGGVFLDPGMYRLGVALERGGELSLVLRNRGRQSEVRLASANAGGGVSHVAFAMLPQLDIERFDLEVRVGSLRGTVPVDFNIKRLIAAMNNTAHDLLIQAVAAEGPEEAKIDLALKLADRANRMTSGENAHILDTYALALFHKGKVSEAIEVQRDAIEKLLPEDEDQRAAMVTQLRAFQLAREKAN